MYNVKTFQHKIAFPFPCFLRLFCVTYMYICCKPHKALSLYLLWMSDPPLKKWKKEGNRSFLFMHVFTTAALLRESKFQPGIISLQPGNVFEPFLQHVFSHFCLPDHASYCAFISQNAAFAGFRPIGWQLSCLVFLKCCFLFVWGFLLFLIRAHSFLLWC